MNRLFFFIFIVTLFFSSCSKMTKDKYMSEYGQFIQQINEKHTTFTAKDWQKADKNYKKYDEKLYNVFQNQLLFEDKLKITRYRIQYGFYKNKDVARENLLQLLDAYYSVTADLKDELKKDIELFIENEINDGIFFLRDQAQQIQSTLLSVCDELKSNNINNQDN